MEKRTMLFIIISLAVIIIWDYLFFQKNKKEVKQNQTVFTANTTVTGTQQKTAVPKDRQVSTVTKMDINTNKYSGIFIKETGFFKRLFLKEYTVDKKRKEPVDLLREGFIDVYDVITINEAPHKVTYSDAVFSENEAAVSITLKTVLSGLAVTKHITIDKNSYAGTIKYSFSNKNETPVKITPAVVISQQFKGIDATEEGKPSPHFFANKSFETPSERQLKKGYQTINTTFGGVAEKYFALFFIDPKEQMLASSLLKEEQVETMLSLASFNLEKDRQFEQELKFFAGPKQPEILKPIGYHLAAAVDYGFFHFIARPLLVILNFFYKYTRNYGISIILLTILIKLAFYPLSQKSYKSMKALQKLQPKMEEIRKKYANDREALNRETMLLYKRYGVNPLSGCLPMLVQIPFFIALYQALMNAIELRHAPFMLWINDLSGKDPLYITPILMGITMLIQQMLTPSSGDPTQKKMMYILPVVFTFMFLNFPSGLVLYWLINNIFSILQQLYTMKKQEV